MMGKKFSILVGAVGFLILGLSASVLAGGGSSSRYLKDARTLYQLNETYFTERQASDWVAIYRRQHPRFRRNIPFI